MITTARGITQNSSNEMTKSVRALRQLKCSFLQSKYATRSASQKRLHGKGKTDVVRTLVKEHGADVDAGDGDGLSPLYIASQHGHVGIVRLVVEEYGADVNAKNHNEHTPLYFASAQNHIGVVRMLVKHCADVNAKDHNGETPLYCASEKGHVDMVRILVEEYGADVNAKDREGHTTPHIMYCLRGPRGIP